jgi:hypothetical protein
MSSNLLQTLTNQAITASTHDLLPVGGEPEVICLVKEFVGVGI